MISVRNISA